MGMRDTFLDQAPSYPSVSRDCYFVSRWQREFAGHSGEPERLYEIAGQLLFDKVPNTDTNQMVQLVSQDSSVQIYLQNAELDSGVEGVPVLDQLVSGDRIRIQFKGKYWDFSKNVIYEAKNILLLSPQLKEPRKASLSFERGVHWQNYLIQLRSFFIESGFIEVDTPALVDCPGMEPELDPFATELQWGEKYLKKFLPTSPEIHLKKALAQGWSEIFEIKKCFRNKEVSDHHEPEFWMLEWYRGYSNLEAIAGDVQQLFTFLDSKGLVIGELKPVQTTRMADLFDQYLNFDLRPTTSRKDLKNLADRNKIPNSDDDSWEDLFHLIFLVKIERYIGLDAPLIVRDYPPNQAALARHTVDGWADRFEVYWRGFELGNAFHELNDPVEQKLRWHMDYEQRLLKGKVDVPIDEEFLEALMSGMPPSGGIAMGVERLYLACQNLNQLKTIKAFPHIERLL